MTQWFYQRGIRQRGIPKGNNGQSLVIGELDRHQAQAQMGGSKMMMHTTGTILLMTSKQHWYELVTACNTLKVANMAG